MGTLSSPMGTGSEPTRSAIFIPAGRRPWRAGSHDGFFVNVPVREEPAVAPEFVPRADRPEDRLDPGVSVERPVAAVPLSSSPVGLLASPRSNLKVGLEVE